MNYVLIEVAITGDSIQETVLSSSNNKELIFSKATKLSEKELKSKSTWYRNSYWIHVFDRKGRRLDELEFDSNGRREGTFGKIVRNRGTKDEKVVGTWRK